MSDVLDYTLAAELAVDTPQRMKALGSPIRLTIVDLVLERAMSVTELSDRLGRPRGSVAHHVKVLEDAGLLRVVRTRRVRAVEERFYGRVARTYVLPHDSGTLPFLDEAVAQFDPAAHAPGGSTFRHARVAPERAEEYIRRLHELALEFSTEPRTGDREFGLMFHVFPTNRRIAPGAAP